MEKYISCLNCKFDDVDLVLEPCNRCIFNPLDTNYLCLWQPKEPLYTRTEVLELMGNAALDVARIKYLPKIRSHKDILDEFDKVKNEQ